MNNFLNFFNDITSGLDPDFQAKLRSQYTQARKSNPNGVFKMKMARATYDKHKVDFDHFVRDNANVELEVR